MCQACLPQLSPTTEASAPAPDSTAVAPRALSLFAFVTIMVCAVMGFMTVLGLLVWLVLWLQPQLAAL